MISQGGGGVSANVIVATVINSKHNGLLTSDGWQNFDLFKLGAQKGNFGKIVCSSHQDETSGS